MKPVTESERMRATVLVPVKDFRQAKARLSNVLKPTQREQLARWTAERVLDAAAPLMIHVVCDDLCVAEWAESRGASVIWRPGLGLNAAVDDGLAALAKDGFTHAVVAHSDLPCARSLADIVRRDGAVLVPDAHRDGTNVVSVPLDIGFRASYGVGSFGRHLAQLRANGTIVEVRLDPLLALDVDTPDDLAHPLVQEVLPEWLRTSPVNRPSTPRGSPALES
jgi:2-phospho-L-lactate guanylyltransferase